MEIIFADFSGYNGKHHYFGNVILDKEPRTISTLIRTDDSAGSLRPKNSALFQKRPTKSGLFLQKSQCSDKEPRTISTLIGTDEALTDDSSRFEWWLRASDVFSLFRK